MRAIRLSKYPHGEANGPCFVEGNAVFQRTDAQVDARTTITHLARALTALAQVEGLDAEDRAAAARAIAVELGIEQPNG
jgi:hypothetical protein